MISQRSIARHSRVKNRLTGALLSLSLALLPAFSWAAAETNAPASAPTQPAPAPLPGIGESILSVTGALVLVIAIFLGFVWLARNWQRFLVQRGRAAKLNILEVRSLGGRHSLYVVGYNQDRFLIATSPTGVNLLSHLPQSDEVPGAPESTAGVPFSQALVQALKGKSK